MACERIKKLLGNSTGSSKNEDEKPESTTQMPQASTTTSSTTSSTTASSQTTSYTTASSRPTSSAAPSSASASLSDFQKKTVSNYENHMNRNCSFKKLTELNPNIEKLDEDILYHIALGNKSHDLQKMFKDVKFIVMGGTPKRMEEFAYYIMNEIGYELPPGTLLNDISKHSHRYAMYKVGPIMSVSHGMGMPSIGILLHELIKLVHHAGMVDPIFIRVGTCGGFSQKAGTVVVSDEVVNDYLESVYELSILGANVRFPATLDQSIASELAALADASDDFKTIKGKTYCTDSFYDGSGRADGAICEFSAAQGMEYYEHLKKNGVVNVEMESLAFAALTCRAGIKSAVLAVILSDRLETDQIKQPKEVMEEWKMRPQRLLARYIKKVLAASGTSYARTTDAAAAQKPTVTVVTPGVTPSGKIVCPPLSCAKKSTGGTTSQPSAVASTQPTTGRKTDSSSCKSVCETRPIDGIGGTTEATKPTSATDSVKSTMAAAKADSQSGWRSCYKACGVGSEQVDAGTPQVSQQPTVKPAVSAAKTETSKSFDCACAYTKVAKPGETPMVKPGTVKSCSDSAPGSTTASTTSGSTTSGPTYKAKDFDSSTKSADPNVSRNAYYKNCVKVPKCDQSGGAQKRQSATFETPVQDKTKGAASGKAGETRPCCARRSAEPQSLRTQVAEKQKYVEDRLEQESQATPGKPSGGPIRRTSMPLLEGILELGPCCTGKVKQKTPKPVEGLELGPCCTGEKDKESPPECSDAASPDSETFASTISEKSEESPPLQSGAPRSGSAEYKGREVPSDCPLVLGKKCNTNAYADNGMKLSSAKPANGSPETPDPRKGAKGPVFSTTPMPGAKAGADPPRDQSTTASARSSCCVKSKNGGAPATLSSTTARQSSSSCCQKLGTARSADSTNGQTKSTAPTSASEQKKLVEDRPTEVSKERRTSTVHSVGGVQLGPCCGGTDLPKVSKKIEAPAGLGPCCTGQKDKESPPECADFTDSKTVQIEEKSDESSLPQSSAPADHTDDSKSTDCIKLLKSKCNYPSDVGRSQKATDRPDKSAEHKASAFSTPLPTSAADPRTPLEHSTAPPAFLTPTPGSRGSCCIKSAADNGALSATRLTARQSTGSCCHQFSSVGSANGASKAVDSTTCQPKSTASTAKSTASTARSTSDANKYDESPSPCAACKKYQDSKIIFTGGTPSVSQPEIIKCPHKLKRLKDECQGYD